MLELKEMKTELHNSLAITQYGRSFVALLFITSLVFSDLTVFAQSGRDPQATSTPAQEVSAPKIPPMLRGGAPKLRPTTANAITDDGDIPPALPPVKKPAHP